MSKRLAEKLLTLTTDEKQEYHRVKKQLADGEISNEMLQTLILLIKYNATMNRPPRLTDEQYIEVRMLRPVRQSASK